MSGRDTRIPFEAGGRRLHRPRARLPHRRRRRRRNHPGGDHRREDENDQSRFRRDVCAASDRGGRTGDDADADGKACAGSGGGVGGGRETLSAGLSLKR
jgi:hypothetical protein